MTEFNDILQQYLKEVESVRVAFETRKDSPPIAKNHPPVAGAIAWARALFYGIKRSIVRFHEMENLMNTKEGEHVKQTYLAVAKNLRNYEVQV